MIAMSGRTSLIRWAAGEDFDPHAPSVEAYFQ